MSNVTCPTQLQAILVANVVCDLKLVTNSSKKYGNFF
jgi:hypothetical protein